MAAIPEEVVNKPYRSITPAQQEEENIWDFRSPCNIQQTNKFHKYLSNLLETFRWHLLNWKPDSQRGLSATTITELWQDRTRNKFDSIFILLVREMSLTGRCCLLYILSLKTGGYATYATVFALFGSLFSYTHYKDFGNWYQNLDAFY